MLWWCCLWSGALLCTGVLGVFQCEHSSMALPARVHEFLIILWQLLLHQHINAAHFAPSERCHGTLWPWFLCERGPTSCRPHGVVPGFWMDVCGCHLCAVLQTSNMQTARADWAREGN
jgi:hypothetical protein